MQSDRKDIIDQLKRDILLMENYVSLPTEIKLIPGPEAIEAAFPFGTIHEFLTFEPEQAAACCGFIGGIMSALMKQDGVCIWVSNMQRCFPLALKIFGMEPHGVVFVNPQREKDVLWATEEALKCKAISIVIAEVGELSFMQSRRLQLAVESSRATGFILRNNESKLCSTVSTARWQITPIASESEDGMLGISFPAGRWIC